MRRERALIFVLGSTLPWGPHIYKCLFCASFLWASEQPRYLSQSKLPCWASFHSLAQAWNTLKGSDWPAGLPWPSVSLFSLLGVHSAPLSHMRETALQAPSPGLVAPFRHAVVIEQAARWVSRMCSEAWSFEKVSDML